MRLPGPAAPKLTTQVGKHAKKQPTAVRRKKWKEGDKHVKIEAYEGKMEDRTGKKRGVTIIFVRNVRKRRL